MSFSAEFSVTSNGTRILVFFRHGREWYADFPIKDQRFAIGAQLAYFLCAYGDRLRQFEAKGAGLLSEGIFPEKISLARGPVREVTWSLYEGFEIGDKEIGRPFLKASWIAGKFDDNGRGFGVEKVRAVTACWRKVSDFAHTYG